MTTSLASRFRARAPFPRGNWLSRLVWLTVLAVPIAVLGLATRLTPTAARGGTHTQLGLEPCGFYDFTGYPCPGCGLTTGFAHMVRGEIGLAWSATPSSVLFFLFTLWFLGFATVGLVRGWQISGTYERMQGERILLGIALVGLAVWLVRIAQLVGAA